METKIHKLKLVNPFFLAVWEGNKTFEVRKNDRDYKEGDVIQLLEYEVASDFYTGREVHTLITYILDGYEAVEGGYIVISFKEFFRLDNSIIK